MEKITIDLPSLREEIFLGKNILEEIKQMIIASKYDKFLIVVDYYAYHHHRAYFESILTDLHIPQSHILFLKPRPQYKDVRRAQILIEKLANIKASRETCIIAIGGGYVGDLAGFVAAIYMRGIDCIQIPTTLMSQSDAIMGKVAVNFKGTKNLVGAFYSPKTVFCEMDFLDSLDRIEKLYGLVEIWKHALLTNNLEKISQINSFLLGGDRIDYQDMVSFSLNVKKIFVEKDPLDKNGQHKALSLGHTLANVLEGDPSFRHGLAVFYGIVFETILAKNALKLSENKYNEILHTAILFEQNLHQFRNIKKMLKKKDLMSELKRDKINSHESYSFVIPTDDGYYVYKEVPAEVINKSLNDFLNLSLQSDEMRVLSTEKL